MSKDMRVKDLKNIINQLPDDMLVVMPVIDENNANHIYGFRRVRTAGVLTCNGEEDRNALCLNSSESGQDIVDQVGLSGKDVDAIKLFYYKGEKEKKND